MLSLLGTKTSWQLAKKRRLLDRTEELMFYDSISLRKIKTIKLDAQIKLCVDEDRICFNSLSSQSKSCDTTKRKVYDHTGKKLYSLKWTSPSIKCSVIHCDNDDALILDQENDRIILKSKSDKLRNDFREVLCIKNLRGLFCNKFRPTDAGTASNVKREP